MAVEEGGSQAQTLFLQGDRALDEPVGNVLYFLELDVFDPLLPNCISITACLAPLHYYNTR